jgi:hypothetical protein
LNAILDCGIIGRMRILSALLVALAMASGCGGSSDTANGAGGMCKLTESPNACLRCLATKCGTQFDFCYGSGFHKGELVAANSGNNGAACVGFAACVQTCGCLDGCFDTCSKDMPNKAACSDCQEKIITTCRSQLCHAECMAGVDGGS